jgi:hypothetical protein
MGVGRSCGFSRSVRCEEFIDRPRQERWMGWKLELVEVGPSWGSRTSFAVSAGTDWKVGVMPAAGLLLAFCARLRSLGSRAL